MVDKRILADRLRNVAQFNDLPSEALITIVSAGMIKQFARGETIIYEEEPCAGMFVLIEGSVNLCKFGPEGQISILTTLTPVIMFNEVAVLDGGTNPVSAVASSEILVWHINYADFQKILLSYPEVGIALLGILARRNRLLIAHYDDLSFRTVQARLAKHLIDISHQGKKTINRSDHPAKIIAARIVTTPEAVSRTLKVFKLYQIISCTRSEINIKDLKRLQSLARMDF